MIADPINFIPKSVQKITIYEIRDLKAAGYKWCSHCHKTTKLSDYGTRNVCLKCHREKQRVKIEKEREEYLRAQDVLIKSDPLYWQKFSPAGHNASQAEMRLLKKHNMRRCFVCKNTKTISEFDKGYKHCKSCRQIERDEKRRLELGLEKQPRQTVEEYICDLENRLKNDENFWGSFRIKASNVKPYELVFLERHNKKWCHKCKKAKNIEEFANTRYCLCRFELEKERYKRRISDPAWRDYQNNIYLPAQRAKNKNKLKENSKKHYHKNKTEIMAKRRVKRDRSPEFRIHEGISNHIRETLRGGKGAKSRKTLEYIGLKSDLELIENLSAKTTNPNWIQDKYHVDHIWQVHWLSDALMEGRDGVVEVLYRHQNLRPLPASANCSRKRTDFLPLVKEDLEIYRPYLNPDILQLIEAYFAQEKV